MNQYKGEAWLGEEPQIREESITETVSADIIVAGGGLAGVAAVRRAAEMGMKVLLFEKMQMRSGQIRRFRCHGQQGSEAMGTGSFK